VRWTEPAVWRETPHGATVDEKARSLRGIEQLRAVTEQPAMFHLTGTTLDSVAPREAAFSMPITGWLRSPQGAVPGGLLAIPADGALGCAIHTDLAAGTAYTTAEISISYLRPARVGTRCSARGRALHIGRTLALSSCDITDTDGALLAHATSRCILFPSAAHAPTRSGIAPPPPAAASTNEPGTEVDPFLRKPHGTVLEQSVWDTMPGLEVLRGQIAGTLPAPPLHHLLGLTPLSADQGVAECVMPMTGWLNTPWGWPQGGFIAVLADTALGMAVQTTVPAATAFAQIDLKVNYLRAVAPDGSLLHARATVAHRGRSLAVASAELTDEGGRRVALATGSAQILQGRSASLGDPA
jgi:uncharacterized protein (TIGR00369 family)